MSSLSISFVGESFGGELSPEAFKIVEDMYDPEAGPIEDLDFHAARTTHALARYDLPDFGGVLVEEKMLNAFERDIPCRVYTPEGEGPFPILVFAHGGCWTFCSLDSHDLICRYYAKEVGCIVVSVDYALAPEFPFPSGVDDFTLAVKWCCEFGYEINGKQECVAIAGDSAGGNLCAVAAQRLQKDYQIALQVLIYPITNVAELSGGTLERYAEGYFFTKEVLEWTSSGYVEEADPKNSEISPIYGDLSKSLAPSFIIIAECDILRDQGIAYAEKLVACGLSVECHLYQGMPHAFMAMAGDLDLGKRALEDSVTKLKESFAKK